jgi:hypothetical protein
LTIIGINVGERRNANCSAFQVECGAKHAPKAKHALNTLPVATWFALMMLPAEMFRAPESVNVMLAFLRGSFPIPRVGAFGRDSVTQASL